ncbi:hypothetical protein SALBM135S_04820 [Streptomyces alboniger]
MTTAPDAGAPPRTALLVPAPTSAPAPRAEALPPVRRLPSAVAGALGTTLACYVFAEHGARPGVLLLLGIGLGFALFHSRFGFTSAWRQLVAVGNGTGLRAHTLLLGTTATLFALIIGTGSGLFGSVPAPSAGPIGAALLIGAFLFAIGMQLGGACASGTLFAVGSGQGTIRAHPPRLHHRLHPRRLAVHPLEQTARARPVRAVRPCRLVRFLGGHDRGARRDLVHRPRRTGPPHSPAGRHPAISARRPPPYGAGLLATGRGRPGAGGAGRRRTAVSGGAWGVTSAFALWGSKVVSALGGSPETWAFWRQPGSPAQLSGPVLADKNSLTDIGIMVGAAVAAAAGGVWRLHRGIPARTALAAVIGGILMGVGARLAGGCNIGAYLAGIASGSLHGWIWGVVAILGTWAGLRLRPLFGLGNPKPTDSVC